MEVNYVKGSLSDDQRDRIRWYTKRIAVLRLCEHSGLHCPLLSLWDVDDYPLTPCLKGLAIQGVGDTLYDIVRLYICSTLRFLTLDVPPRGSKTDALLNRIWRTCTKLNRLVLADCDMSDEHCIELAKLAIHALRVGDVEAKGWGQISGMTALTQVWLGLEEDTFEDATTSTTNAASYFPRLEMARIEYAKEADAIAALRLGVMPTLRGMTLARTIDTDLSVDLVTAVAKGCEASSATMLTITSGRLNVDGEWNDIEERVARIAFAHITPLFAWNGLTRLLLDLEYVEVHLSDDNIGAMADQWPRLQVLQLGNCGWRNRSQLTARAIARLAASCRELACLGLVIDATEADVFENLRRGEPNRCLKTLHLSSSRIGPFTAKIADGLYQIAPLAGINISRDLHISRGNEREVLSEDEGAATRKLHKLFPGILEQGDESTPWDRPEVVGRQSDRLLWFARWCRVHSLLRQHRGEDAGKLEFLSAEVWRNLMTQGWRKILLNQCLHERPPGISLTAS